MKGIDVQLCTMSPECQVLFHNRPNKKGHAKVVFCPMQEMVADFFMKPLQGALVVSM